MTRTKSRLALGGSIAALALGLAAAQADTPRQGGAIHVVVTPEPPSIVTGLFTNTPTQMVGGGMFESLLMYSTDLEPMPSLAESWEISDDELHYTFTLRQDVRWHDGEPFTADDVMFSLLDFLVEVNPRWRGTMDAHIDTIEKLSDHQVRITLNHPFDPLMLSFENGTMPIMARHIYEGTDFASNPMNQTPVGTGPMRFGEWRAGSFVHLVRNDDYYLEGKPYVDEVFYRFIPDAASRAIAFETGDVDVLTGGALEVHDVRRLEAREDTCVTTAGWELFAPLSYVQMNVRSGPLANPTFRQGLMYALDREFIRDAIWSGFGEVATGPISSRTRFHSDDVRHYDFDPDRARELIAEAGYDGERLRYMVVPYGEIWSRTAEIVRQNFADVGVTVDLVSSDPAGWNQRVRDGDFELTNNWPYQFGDPALGVSRMWISAAIDAGTPFSNVGGFSNAEVDRLFAEGAVAPAEARPAIYAEIQRILTEDLPALWSVDIEFPTVYRCDVRDFVTTATGANEAMRTVWLDR